MKNKFLSYLVIFLFMLSFLTVSSMAEAYRCKWVRGHWYHGRWIPAHKVCWRTHHHHRWHHYY